jgi:hypothetical protein
VNWSLNFKSVIKQFYVKRYQYFSDSEWAQLKGPVLVVSTLLISSRDFLGRKILNPLRKIETNKLRN